MMKIIEMVMTLMTFADVHLIHLIVKYGIIVTQLNLITFSLKKLYGLVINTHWCIFSH